MSNVIVAITTRGIIVAEAASAETAQALQKFMGEVITGAANTFNNYQDVQAIYDD